MLALDAELPERKLSLKTVTSVEAPHQVTDLLAKEVIPHSHPPHLAALDEVPHLSHVVFAIVNVFVPPLRSTSQAPSQGHRSTAAPHTTRILDLSIHLSHPLFIPLKKKTDR